MKKQIINYLLKHNNINHNGQLNDDDLIRALMNISKTDGIDDNFYNIQDLYLQERLRDKVIISNFDKQINIYKGDITILKVDAIVNAANEKLLGCFQPLHNCVDNAIHSSSGLQVRRDLTKIMERQNHDEENGKVKVTLGYNLPSKYIFHTVGPKVFGSITQENTTDLKNSYINCLKEAERLNLDSIAFPCISTGIYGYPNHEASVLAFNTVTSWLKKEDSKLKVIFNVFKDIDEKLYKNIEGGIYEL